MATSTGTIVNQAGQATRQGVAVHIDRDVTPAWETGALPDWVVYTLVPLLSAGQEWPKASESKLSELAQAWEEMAAGLPPHAEPAGKAVRTVVAGWQAPATADFVGRAQNMFGNQAGLNGISRGALGYSGQASDFAVETQYSKLSVNVAFWVTAVAIAIAMYVAFFTAGSTTPLIGPYAQAGRAAIGRILARLAAVAGRGAGATQVAKLAALSGPTGRSLIARLLASPLGRELIEEMGEEFFIDGVAQYQQIQMGTRTDWDWDKSKAALIGAGTGAVAGMQLAGPISRITSNVPGFAGRALSTGVSNMVASPAGSYIANGVVYGEWSNPFSGESLAGAFFGGVGRTGSISPFNPEVYTALSHPTTTLASAYDMAAQSDARRMGLTIDPNAGGGSGGDATGTGGAPGGTGGGGAGGVVAGAGAGAGGGGRASGGATRGGTSVSTPSGGGTASRTGPVTADAEDGGRRAVAPTAADAEGRGSRRSQPDDKTRTDAEANSDPDTSGDTSPDTAPRAANDAKTDTDRRATTDTDEAAATTPDEEARDKAGEQETRPRVAVPDEQATTPDVRPDATTSPDATARTQPDAAPAAPDARPEASPVAPETQPDATSATPDQSTDPAPAASDAETRTDGSPDGAPTTDTGATRDTAPAPDSGTVTDGDTATDGDTGAAVAPNSTPDARPAPDTAPDTAQGEATPTTLAQEETNPHLARAREAVFRALLDGHPNAVLLPDGGLIVPLQGADVVVPPAAVARVIDSMRRRSAQVEDDEALQAEALAMLDEQFAADTTPEDAYAGDLAPGQPVGLRADAALDYALNRLAPGAVLLADGGHLVSDESGHYVITPRMLRAVRSVLEAAAANGHDAAALRTQALLAMSQAMAVSQETSPAPEPVTSRPGTVTSRPIAGTWFVPDGRPNQRLTDDEVSAEVEKLLASQFTVGEVESWAWSRSEATLVVKSTDHGTQRFRIVIGGLDSRLMAETHVNRSGGDQIIHMAPHMAPDQIARVVLHEITDTLHELSRPEQGVIRRTLFRRGRQQNELDGCVPARLNEYAYLVHKWQDATSADERWKIQVDLDGIARDLREHGQIPPPPPWGVTPPVRQVHAPTVADAALAELRRLVDDLGGARTELADRARPYLAELQRVADDLTRAEEELRKQAESHEDTAGKAEEEANAAKDKAGETAAMRDRGKEARKANHEKAEAQHRAKQARHLRIAEAYAKAREKAEAARNAYRQVAGLVRLAATSSNPQEASLAMSRLTSLLADARTLHDEYLKSVNAALPPEVSLPSALPTRNLAHLTPLTDMINKVLAENGSPRRFTPRKLEHILRADFRKVVSPDGAILRIGTGKSAVELKIRLSLSDMVQIIDPEIVASEIMLGVMPQGGRSARTGEAGSGGLTVPVGPGLIAPMVPEEHIRTALEIMGNVGINVSFGRSWSRGPGAADYALAGAVEDNRGESLLFDAAATWSVSVRTPRQSTWQEVGTISSGAPGDAPSQRIWVSHAYTVGPPERTATIDPGKESHRLPEHFVNGLTGLDQLADDVIGRLHEGLGRVRGRAGVEPLHERETRIGRITRQQILTMINDELPGRLGEATDPDYGMTRVITDRHGRPVATVTIRTTVQKDSAVLVGQATRDHWQERLRVGNSNATGSESFNGSLSASVSALPIPVLGDMIGGVPVPGGYGDVDVTAGAGRGVSRSQSSFANGNAIHPSVQRYTGHTQGYQLTLKHEVTIVLADGSRVLDKVTGTSEGLFRMPETDAYRYGLPVDEAALLTLPNGKPRRDRHGDQMLRGDPERSRPPGRKMELPTWLRPPQLGRRGMAAANQTATDQAAMHGAGPALVQRLTGVDEVRKQVLEKLADLGLVPKFENGVPQYSRLPIQRAGQMANLREVLEQLSSQRLETGYDQAAQDGIPITLTRDGFGRSSRTYTLLVRLEQDHDAATYLGRTDTEAVVNLDIGSDTAGRGSGRSWTGSLDVPYSTSEGSAEGEDGQTRTHERKKGGNYTRSTGSSVGGTVNRVTLVESGGEVALFDVPHKVVVDIVADDKVVDQVSGDGSARLVFATDLLPVDTPHQPHKVGRLTEEVLSRATLLHMDTTGMLERVRQVLPRSMRRDSAAYHHFVAFSNVRNLIAHPEWRNSPYGTGVGVRPQGALPTEASLTINGSFGEASLVGVADLVVGDINFTMGSAGVSWGRGWGTSGGSSNSISDSDGHGAAHQGGGGSHTGSGGRSRSHGQLDIWGREQLIIETGKQYIFRGTVDFALEGKESVPDFTELGGSAKATTGNASLNGRPVVYSIPEYDALTFYTEGKLDLPLSQVADAVERFVNGSLTLDRTLATSLVQKYLVELKQARDAGKNVSFADGHTADTLLPALIKVSGLEQVDIDPKGLAEQERLDRALSEAADLTRKLRQVRVAPHYDGTVGFAAVETFAVTDKTASVTVLDAVQTAIDEAAPGAVDSSPVMRRSLNVDFAGDRVRGHVNDMLSPRGYVKTYETLADPSSGRAELVTVRAKLVPVPGSAELVGRTYDAGLIQQDYLYREVSDSGSYSGSHSFSLSGSGDGSGAGADGSVSTDRGRSYGAASTEQVTRLQRIAQFGGVDRVQQRYQLVIEVERTPVRMGPGRQPARHALDRVKRRGDGRSTKTFDAVLVRRMPIGMTRPVNDSTAEPDWITDTRRAELPPAHYVSSVHNAQDGRPSLYDAVQKQLTSMVGATAAREQMAELEARLSPMSMTAAFGQMAAPGGHELVPTIRKGTTSQGVDVRVEAHLSDLQVVSGPVVVAPNGDIPVEAELGVVDRVQHTSSISTSRGRLLPISSGVGGQTAFGHISASVGEQASDGVSDNSGLRNEASTFERARVVTVRARVDYDLTFQHKTRSTDGNEAPFRTPVRLPSAASGEVLVVMFEADFKEMQARMEAGVQARPGWDFTDESQPRSALKQPEGPHQRLDPSDLLGHATRARQQARDEGQVVRFTVRDGQHADIYLAAPDGSLHSVKPDGGFTEAVATLPPHVLDAAAGLDLRQIFTDPQRSGTLTDRVMAALADQNVEPAAPTPVWPSESAAPGAEAQGGSVGQSAAGAPSPALPGTPFDTQARPAGVPDLTVTELVGQNISVADFGGGVTALDWSTDQGVPIAPDAPPADLDGAVVAVTTPTNGVQHARVVVGDPGEGRTGYTTYRSGTPEDPHIITIAPRTDPAVVSSVLVHEISHVADQHAAEAAGAPQGVIRSSLPEHAHEEGTDHCLTPRLNEHAHLSRKWSETTDPVVKARIAEAIDAIADDIAGRGHTPPAPPWQATETTTESRAKPSIADLLNGDASPAPAAPQAVQARPLTLPERAAADAAERAAADMGASVRRLGGGLLEVTVPGGETVTVRVGSAPDPGTAADVDVPVRPYLTIGANQRAAAAAVAQAVAEASGLPTSPTVLSGAPDADALTVSDARALAELGEAVRQVDTATPQQRAARLRVLVEIAGRLGLAAGGAERFRGLAPDPLLDRIAALVDGPRPSGVREFLERGRRLSDVTGWQPPEEDDDEDRRLGPDGGEDWDPLKDDVCRCPAEGPCVCGRRGEAVLAEA
ncbi:WXG100-like domain-containing protein [Microtetraspora fusca]|uniref:WXG100-like domain-containing protein n=1 Tax=Microtetraspora fusca TaxID=1997 RepID=UPI00082C1247|nr:hypothetical protein [Microtetraspora fusca]